MKKSILMAVMASALMASNCKKNNKTANPEAYCVYGGNGQFISCEKNANDAQNKCVQLRNQGQTGASSVKKSSCSEC
jgi:peptidoglycan hydrolase CwlO-like protein